MWYQWKNRWNQSVHLHRNMYSCIHASTKQMYIRGTCTCINVYYVWHYIERLHVTSSPIETNAKFHVNSLPYGKQDSCTNLHHTRATVTALLDFLYKWMPLHLVYTIPMLVCEETCKWPCKASGWVWTCHAEVKRKWRHCSYSISYYTGLSATR